MEGLSVNIILEAVGVVLNLAFLFLMIKENKLCWIFGILGSLVSICLFYRTQLYSESILYVFYVFIGFYGYYLWDTKDRNNQELKITSWGLKKHVLVIVIGVLCALGLGFVFERYTDAKNAFFDAFTTMFSFIASYLEAKKILSTWHFWIIINGATIYLYYLRSLDLYAILTIVYFVSSFLGLYNWRRIYQSGLSES